MSMRMHRSTQICSSRTTSTSAESTKVFIKIAAAIIKTDEDGDRVQGFQMYTAKKAQGLLKSHQRKRKKITFPVDTEALKEVPKDPRCDLRLKVAHSFFDTLRKTACNVRQASFMHENRQKSLLDSLVDSMIQQMGVTREPDSPTFIMFIGNGVDSLKRDNEALAISKQSG